jgi:hypothetical protein
MICTLVALGLIRYHREGYVLSDGRGNGVGPIHHSYRKAETVSELIGSEVTAIWGVTGDVRAVGRVIAVSVDPMALIVTPDGERVWWSQRLVRPRQTGESE